MAADGTTLTGGGGSAEILAEDEYRDFVLIQVQSDHNVFFGYGEDAALATGVGLLYPGDCVKVTGPKARTAINAISAGNAVLGWETGREIEYVSGQFAGPWPVS